MGLHWSSTTKTIVHMHDLGELHKHATTTKKAKSLRQASSKINHYNNKEYPTDKCRNHDRSIAHRANDAKTGISAHIRLRNQLAVSTISNNWKISGPTSTVLEVNTT